MSSSASTFGIVAGVVGEDGRGKVPFALGSPCVPEDRRQRSEKPLPERAQGLDQRRVIARIPDHGRQKSVGDERRYGFPAILDCGGPGVGQGTGCAKAFLGVGLRIIEQRPQPLIDPRMVLLQDAPDHRQVDGRGRQETVVEIVAPVVRRRATRRGWPGWRGDGDRCRSRYSTTTRRVDAPPSGGMSSVLR